MQNHSVLSDKDWLDPQRLRRIGLIWLAAAVLTAAYHLWTETRIGLTNGHDVALGEDFINFWSGAVLAANGQAHAVYNFAAFHRFQLALVRGPIQLYHYSYPPVMMMLCRPLAFLPYIPALVLWSLSGLAAFAFALRLSWPSPGALLYALAVPAAFINLMDGQNGLWTAAILGTGLAWLPARPAVSGALFGVLLACKPQLVLLVPLALLAGRNWKALGAMAVTVLLLMAATLPLYGWNIWTAYAGRVAILRHAVLENGGTWIYMPSVFIMVRHLPAQVAIAYAAQALATLAVSALVIHIWRQPDQSRAVKNMVLVLCLLLASPYIQYYDLAIATLVPVWQLGELPAEDPRRPAVFLTAFLLLAAPALSPLLARGTGLAAGWLLLLPALWLALRLHTPAAKVGWDT